LKQQLARCRSQNLVQVTADGRLRLSSEGRAEASRLVHNHRLWELYLMTHADVAAARVDREADAIEHVLEPELIAKLEALLELEHTESGIPESPHRINPAGTGQSSAGLSSSGAETVP
jgi:manganese/zinc/iron transport system permease protein